ncbi:hypothetical protein HYPBUDRAFT_6619 [Hyphopichia burtonii NRRL Y-1933]|uniref:Tetratricopeptide SHNi-TPR domain-containing protein n=1 Tax=Hyphopichia burtonii NRRL Y-1933 TaxID=984485 RepID=A0A1E4RJA0_9ASCO|nr:hypothetical protein HYPBUDRAFT_6619 [Hyphopichia burtonii NRRL Y-1933]ODV67347.1 hypothetical protein HYPBUDRAFT_6619 [Hyphopichia burtonii NRRL Y-1933]
MAYSPEVSKLIAEGSKLYAVKEYDLASSKYADACELFNKENSSDDGDLLLLYGKSLFQSAVLKSEVFGGKPEESESKKEEEDKEKEDKDDKFQFHENALAEEDDDAVPVAEEEDSEEGEEEGEEESKDESKDEEEEQSDFEIAWEILDLTRSIFESKIEDLKELESKISPPYLSNDREETTNEYLITLKKLSETYDILGEVSLESENFSQSAIDLENCLNLRLKLYNPKNSSLISESHYKLSLALEFCVEDPDSRSKAANQMKLAIDSVKLRNENESDPKKKQDNEDLVKDLLVRYKELEKDPAEELKLQQMDIIKGILGEATSSDSNQPKPSSSTPAVNDLTSVVKKRKPTKSSGNDFKKQKK